MTQTNYIKVSSPFEAILVGLTNFYFSKTGVSILDYSSEELKKEWVEKSVYRDYIYFFADKGYLNVPFNVDEYLIPESYLESMSKYTTFAYKVTSVENILYVSSDDFLDDAILRQARYNIGNELALLCMYIGANVERKSLGYSPVSVRFEGDFVSSYLFHMPYLHYLKELGYLNFEYRLNDTELDIVNTAIFTTISKFQGFFSDNLLSFGDKLANLKSLGLVKGSIVFLYKRSKHRLLVGKSIVESCRLAKISEITNRKVVFTTYKITKSYEQLWLDFCEFPEHIQDMYHQFTEFAPYVQKGTSFEVPLDSLGVSYMMNHDNHFSEQYFVTPIESIYPAELTVINEEGKFDTLKCSTVDAVLYLLKEYNIKFSEKLFQKQYGNRNLDFITKLAKRSIRDLVDKIGYDFRKD